MANTTLTYALLGVLLASGLAAAQEGSDATPTPMTAANEPTFAMRFDPAEQRIAPGGSVTFALVVRTVQPTTLKLAVERHSGEGYGAALSSESVDVPASGETKVLLKVSARENASSAFGVTVSGTDPSGVVRYATAKAALAKPAPAAPTETFALGARPDVSGIHSGAEARYVIYAKSRVAQTLKLGVGANVDKGYAAKLTNDSMDVAPDAPGETTLVVAALDGATTRFPVFEVYAIGLSGERHATHVKAELLRDAKETKPRPEPKPQPTQTPAPARVPAPSAQALLDGIELSIEGFDAGGLQISLKVGDAGTIHLRVSAESLRAAHDLIQKGDPREKAHGRLWLRLQRADEAEDPSTDAAANG